MTLEDVALALIKQVDGYDDDEQSNHYEMFGEYLGVGWRMEFVTEGDVIRVLKVEPVKHPPDGKVRVLPRIDP